MTETIDSEVSGIMRASIGGKVNLNVLPETSGRNRRLRARDRRKSGRKKQGKRKNFKKCVIFKKKSPANTLFTGLFLVPVAGVEPARVLAQRILSPPRLPIPTHRRLIYDTLSGVEKSRGSGRFPLPFCRKICYNNACDFRKRTVVFNIGSGGRKWQKKL